jgi:ribosomal protein S27AE
MPLVNLFAGRMTSEQANEVIQALKSKGVTRPCPRCGNSHFTLLEGFFNQPLSGDLTSPSGTRGYPSGPTVPSIVTACARCGFLSQHALGVLELSDRADNPAFGLAG